MSHLDLKVILLSFTLPFLAWGQQATSQEIFFG